MRELVGRTMTQAMTLFEKHSNLSNEINRRIIQSEIEGGVQLRDLQPGAVLEVQTRQRTYTIVYQGDSEALISGHPVYCPDPVLVDIHGSTWGGRLIRRGYIGRGLHLEFGHPDYVQITTSRILDVQQRTEAQVPFL